jgi:hypothetical protein
MAVINYEDSKEDDLMIIDLPFTHLGNDTLTLKLKKQLDEMERFSK